MARENAKRATMKDLIARKMRRDADRFKTVEIYVPSMDAKLIFKKPPDDLLLDAIDAMGDGDSVRTQMAAMKPLIYQTCELLQSPELHKELDIVDPLDTVDALFDLADLGEISTQMIDLFGMGNTEEAIKNA